VKRITLVCDVKDEDAEEIAQSAKEAFPTWKVSIENQKEFDGRYL